MLLALSTTLVLALGYLLLIARRLAQLRSVLAAVAVRTAPLDADLRRLKQTFAGSAEQLAAARTRLVGDAETGDPRADAKPLTNVAPRGVQ